MQMRVLTMLIAGVLLAGPVWGQDCGPGWEPPFEVDAAVYPFEHRCVQLADGVMHYVDEVHSPEPRGTVLLIHGNPTWSFMYRDVIIGLRGQGFRVIAPDLLGFGMSSKPDPDVFAYSARSQARALREFVNQLDLQDVTLVVHDWGGPIGLHTAGGDPDRFSSLVILNTWAWSLHESDRPYFHFLFDWLNYNIVNTDWLLETGHLPFAAGRSIASIHAPPGRPLNTAVRNGIWGPFLNLDTGVPLSRDAIEPTNRLYHFVGRDPQFMTEVEAGVELLKSKPVAFVFCEQDQWFGALRCDDDQMPRCPDGLHCEEIEGRRLCLDDNGERFYPTVERFVNLWDASAVRLVDIRPGGGHFTPEFLHDEIVDAILLLRSEPADVQLRR